MQNCFLCGSSTAGKGCRALAVQDLQLLGSLPVDDKHPLPVESANILEQLNALPSAVEETSWVCCWSSCPGSTRLFTIRAQANLHDEPPIRDGPFDLGFIKYDPAHYDDILTEKRDAVAELLRNEGIELPRQVESIRSPPSYFRQRVRLGAYVSADGTGMHYLMWNNEGIPCRLVEQFPIASKLINHLLSPLKALLLARQVMLAGLSAVHFLTTLSGEALITLVYNASAGLDSVSLQEAWSDCAKEIVSSLLCYEDNESSTGGGDEDVGIGEGSATPLKAVSIVGSSKGVRLVVPPEATSVTESLRTKLPIPSLQIGIGDQHQLQDVQLRYQFPFDGFSNPNAHVNTLCLEWLSKVAFDLHATEDLLELYCGAGNHTCAIARYFPKVLCVELNKSLCKCAEHNLALNGVTNVRVMAMYSETMARILKRKSGYTYRGEKTKKKKPKSRPRDASSAEEPGDAEGAEDTVEYNFGTLLVDPPRGGLDQETRNLMNNFDKVLYISCNPVSLARDLQGLCTTDGGSTGNSSSTGSTGDGLRPFRVMRFTVLDHFAYSVGHIESAVLLQR